MELIYENLEPTITTDAVQDGIRYVSAQCSELVCSQNILMSLTPVSSTADDAKIDYIINKVQYVGGCQGNTTAVCALVKGMKASEVITRLEGINCQRRGTSCPDQLARILKKITL